MTLALLLTVSLCALSQSQSYESLVEQAIRAASNDSLKKAESLFKQTLGLYPGDHRNALIFTDLGKVQEALGNSAEALQSYTSALKLAPQSIPILTARADLHLRNDNYSKALIDYGNIIEADPQNTHAFTCRAYTLVKCRRYAEARIDYEKALEIEPKNYAAQLGLAILYQETNKRAEALSRITLMIGMFPDKAELYSIRAEMEQEAGHAELALIDMNKAVELEPENKNYVLTRAYIHLAQNNKYYARKDFEKAIKLGVPRHSLKEELKKTK